ncbi:MAG: GIY-YIG nuclease family protein [Rhodospirillales bacterium]
MEAWVYILECADGRYYVGSARGDLDRRVDEHNHGSYDGYTKRRRPVKLVFSESYDRVVDAIDAERKLKGWSRAKKEALIQGDFESLKALSGSLYKRQAEP